ncbi:hypothetical protein WAI453_007059 [Rhynchosporium graminicola]
MYRTTAAATPGSREHRTRGCGCKSLDCPLSLIYLLLLLQLYLADSYDLLLSPSTTLRTVIFQTFIE